MKRSQFRIKFPIAFLIGIYFSGCVYHYAPIEEVGFQPPATEDIVMYEINTPRFSITHDFQGIIDRLDSIKALGINTIWLMPIYPTGIVNSFGSPYCVRDYIAVNTSFGTMDDLQLLVNLAHEKNIAVILDWVANHTSWDNAWINNDGWYTEDASGNIISPPGTTWTDVADLNFDNSDMRLAMIDAMKFWIETTNIDGFRCDAADFIPFDFWQQAIDSLNNIPNKEIILLAEGARSDHFTAGFQINYSWSFLGYVKNVFNSNTSVAALFTTNEQEYNAIPDGAKKLRFTTNHDESNIETPVTLFGGIDAALAASIITFYLEGVPLIYCGQEVGVSSSSVYTGAGSINWAINPDLYATYKKLMNFYNNSDALRKGILETFNDTDVAIFRKSLNGEEALVIVNTRASAQIIDVPLSLEGEWTNAMDESSITLNDNLTLSPYQYWVM
ncbi:MAG: alpha-amylase family glycosyl hydrolase, partial [Chitinophagales bacterium]